jgi:hypothetical protein
MKILVWTPLRSIVFKNENIGMDPFKVYSFKLENIGMDPFKGSDQ